MNRKIGSQKAISIILRREATKAVIEKKGGPNNSKKLLPKTVLEALHERVTALRWESALKVSRWSILFNFVSVMYVEQHEHSLQQFNCIGLYVVRPELVFVPVRLQTNRAVPEQLEAWRAMGLALLGLLANESNSSTCFKLD